jgi:hypothetical protein
MLCGCRGISTKSRKYFFPGHFLLLWDDYNTAAHCGLEMALKFLNSRIGEVYSNGRKDSQS